MKGDMKADMKESANSFCVGKLRMGLFQMDLQLKSLGVLLVALILLIGLGFWQLQRAEEKRDWNSAQILKEQQAAQPLVSVMSDAESSQRVSFQGEYLSAFNLMIANQRFNGQPGYEVITPVRTGHGIVLVSRGWQASLLNPENDKLLQNLLTITGTIFIAPDNSFFLPPKVDHLTWPMTLHHFDLRTVLDIYAEVLEEKVQPFIVRLDAGNIGVLERHWPVKRLDPSVNTSYAWQWFAMALVALLIYIGFNSNAIQLLQEKSLPI